MKTTCITFVPRTSSQSDYVVFMQYEHPDDKSRYIGIKVVRPRSLNITKIGLIEIIGLVGLEISGTMEPAHLETKEEGISSLSGLTWIVSTSWASSVRRSTYWV